MSRLARLAYRLLIIGYIAICVDLLHWLINKTIFDVVEFK